MYQLTVQGSFEAAHRLVKHNGPCARLHGHHWVVRMTCQKDTLDMVGMSIDLVLMKRDLMACIRDFDHNDLNRVLDTNRPTAENLAKCIWRRLEEKDIGKYLAAVEIEETPGCVVRYVSKDRFMEDQKHEDSNQ